MLMKLRAIAAGFVLAALLIGTGLIYHAVPGSHAQAAPNAMAVDADAGTAGVDAARSVSGTASFTTAVNVTLAGTAYAGYQVELSWPAGLSIVGSTQLQPASMALCGTPILT